MLQEKTVINDCYILQSEIGEDSYTEHWIATAIFSAKRFLLRFLREDRDSSEYISRLRADTVRSYRVRGPSISDFVELESFQGRLFISSEYNAESSLLRVIESGRQWSLSQIVNVAIGLADGLSSFHALDIAYGNLNAENVIITERGEQTPIVKIRKPSLLSLLPLTGENAHDVTESYSYLAPEFKRDAVLRAEGDIFSVGVHLFRFFTGALPYPDDAEAIRVSGPSLRYATIALFRCGVPEGLVAIVIGALMRNPEARYRSCLELISALRGVLSSLKGEAATFEENTPLPSVPSFESVDYFSEISSAQIAAGSQPDQRDIPTARRYPDRQESRPRRPGDDYAILDEESTWTVDDYLAYGMKTVFGSGYARASRGKANFGAIDIPERDAAPSMKGSVQENNDTAAARSTSGAQIAAPARVAVENTAEQRVTVTMSNQESDAKKEERVPPSDDGAVNQFSVERKETAPSTMREGHAWTRHRIRIIDIKDIIARAAKRAEGGRGSFRFIEEPREYFAPNGLFDLLESFAVNYLYVNAGDFSRYGTADLQNCAEMLRKGFTRALAREREGSRRYLARKLIAADPERVFIDRRLGNALGIKDCAPNTRVDWRSRDTHLKMVAAIRAFARKSRPVVLVIRGGESVSRNLHEFLSSLAGSVDDAPVAVIVFFGRSPVEPWHALSRLESRSGDARD